MLEDYAQIPIPMHIRWSRDAIHMNIRCLECGTLAKLIRSAVGLSGEQLALRSFAKEHEKCQPRP